MLGQPSAIAAGFSRRRMSPAFGQGGMVAAAHPLTVAVALDVLKRGGDAVDAAFAGGGGAAQAIARDPLTGVLAGGSDPRAEDLALRF
jgi:gamma-glutamyltranspeptidase